MFKCIFIYILTWLVLCSNAHKTYVSLTFDDVLIEHYNASKMMEEYGMRGTFYINSGRVGLNDKMTTNQLLTMQTNGHEIGGHTIDHINLASASNGQRRIQICNDKRDLVDMGLVIESFAYPFGADFEGAKQFFEDCEYKYARDSGGLKTPLSCEPCPEALIVSDIEKYNLKSISYRLEMGYQFLLDRISDAHTHIREDHWLIFIFHEIGNFPNLPNSITYNDLRALLEALSQNDDVIVEPLSTFMKNVELYNSFEPPAPTTTTKSPTVPPTKAPTQVTTSEPPQTSVPNEETTTIEETTSSEETEPANTESQTTSSTTEITITTTQTNNITTTPPVETNSSYGGFVAALVVPIFALGGAVGIYYLVTYCKKDNNDLEHQFEKSSIELKNLKTLRTDNDLSSQFANSAIIIDSSRMTVLNPEYMV